MPHTQERQGVGRRQADQECIAHEERLDAVERKLAWQKGAMYVIVGFVGVSMPVIGWMGNAIYGKVSSIEIMLNRNELASTVLTEQVKSIDRRVQAIEDRHVYEQQNGTKR